MLRKLLKRHYLFFLALVALLIVLPLASASPVGKDSGPAEKTTISAVQSIDDETETIDVEDEEIEAPAQETSVSPGGDIPIFVVGDGPSETPDDCCPEDIDSEDQEFATVEDIAELRDEIENLKARVDSLTD